MTFRTIHTFEKQGANFYELIPTIPGLSSCEFFFKDSPHVELFELRMGSDKAYVEVHVYFKDESNYLEWHSTAGPIHDDIRNSAYEVMEAIGVDVKRYWETTDLSAPGSLPITEFVSKYEVYTELEDPFKSLTGTL
jgi:hypothetical protein